MRQARTTIAGIMAAIAVVAFGLAALRSGSVGWFQAAYALTLVVLLAASLRAGSTWGRSRAFWYGFALFGWAYLLLGAGNLGAITFGYGQPSSGRPSDLLPVTGWLSAALDGLVDRDRLWSGSPMAIGPGYDIGRYNRVLWIAQFLVDLLVGFLGGIASLLLHDRGVARIPDESPGA